MAVASTSIALESWGFEGLDYLPSKIDLPIILVSPEKIFSNEVPLLDVNIINPNKEYKNPNDGSEEKSVSQILQSTIASWYVALRNLAIVGLLSILVYIGIRMIISSTASDKAKYKQMIIDWIVALCLLFFMHYIMSFAITMVESITEVIKQSNQSIEVPIKVSDIEEKYKVGEYKDLLHKMEGENGGYVTDLMGFARFKAQLNYAVEGRQEGVVAEGGRAQMAYTIIYFVLVIYTIMFLFIYIKRLMYIIFLTMIAPLVALTYPIDKLNDGQAQAFNMWLKEYIFNLLIQPLHLLIYNILLGSAMNLATEYMIYPLVVLGFMLQAEKILRRFFGFEKASTASSIASGALGGAAVMTAINKLGGRTKKSEKGQKGNSSESLDRNNKIRMSERSADNANDQDNFISGALGGVSNKEDQEDINDSNKNDNYALDRYSNEGYGQNIEGEYYNPWTDEYAPNYNPANDPNYMQGEDNDIEFNDNESDNNEDAIDMQQNNNYDDDDKMHFFSGVKSLAGRYIAPNIGKAGMGLLKGTAKGIGAATLGTIGIAAGLASDDYSNVAKYGVAAATIGSGIGGSIGDKAINLPSKAYRKGTEAVDTFRQGAYSQNKYKEFVNKRLDNEFMKNKENQQLYKEEFGVREKQNKDGKKVEAYKVAMEQALEYRAQGVTDNKIIIKAMKVQSKHASKDWNDRRRIVSAKFASQVSNEKDVENLQKRLGEKGIEKSQIKDQADMIRKIRGLY